MQGWDGYRAADVARVNARYGFIIEPFAPLLRMQKCLISRRMIIVGVMLLQGPVLQRYMLSKRAAR